MTPPKRITLSPALIATLVKLQHAKAETLMALCAREDMVRQELAALEEVIRIATAKEGGG